LCLSTIYSSVIFTFVFIKYLLFCIAYHCVYRLFTVLFCLSLYSFSITLLFSLSLCLPNILILFCLPLCLCYCYYIWTMFPSFFTLIIWVYLIKSSTGSYNTFLSSNDIIGYQKLSLCINHRIVVYMNYILSGTSPRSIMTTSLWMFDIIVI
jgi:hypothetical protein